MSDDGLLRRMFLKLGLAGAGGGSLFDRHGGESGRSDDAVARPGGGSDASARDRIQADFLPPRADVLSLQGLDSSSDFALSDVASDHAVDRRPLSVRELVTPQNARSTTDADTYDDLENLGSGRVREVLSWLDWVKRINGGLAQRFGGGGGVSLTDRITWGNWLQDPDHMTHATVVGAELSSHEGTDVDPGTRQRRQLIGTVVRQSTGTFRGMGSGHSHSEAAMPKEGFNDLKNVDGKLPQPDRWIKDNPPAYPPGSSGTIDTDHLIRVGAGTILKTLNRAILPQEGKNGLALPNMGSWDGQTLAGAINTATHGTGLGLGSLADLVRSVEIAVVPESPTADEPLVRMLRIEPDDGITDPVAFARDSHSHDTTLIQNSDLFHSVVVGYGSMGIVYAYTLECRDPFWLRESNSTPRWNEIDPVAGARRARHYKVNINLAAGSRNPQCWVRTWTPASANGRQPTERNETVDMIGKFIQNLPQNLGAAIQNAGGLQSATPGTVYVRQPPWRGGKDVEEVAPFNKGRQETASYIALRRRPERYPNQPEKPPEQPMDVISTEVIVPLSRTQAAAQAIIDHVHRHNRWFPFPMSIRYAAGSEHYLSPEYGLDNGAAIIELLIPVPEIIRAVEVGPRPVYTDSVLIVARKVKEFLIANGDHHLTEVAEAKRELEAVEDILVNNFGGRPHLGKHNTVETGSSRSYMRPGNLFPKYGDWLAAHRYVNQYGTFDAKFTDNKVR